VTRRCRRLRGAALAVLLITGIGQATAQESPAISEAEQRQQRLENFDPGPVGEPGETDLIFPQAPDPSGLSAATAEAYQASLQAYYTYRRVGYEQRLGVFAWQLLSTKVIFFVVLLLVLAGIVFAAIQFHSGLRRRGEGEVPSPQETELSLSLREVNVRSPVLGVIILTISLAFFYLYLVHVYPIRNVF
jgi:hypothetical protein